MKPLRQQTNTLSILLATVLVVLVGVSFSAPASGQSIATPTMSITNPGPSHIAFTSKRDGTAQIYVMNADGTAQTNLSENKFNDSDPTWSPDGSQIAFDSDRDGNSEICIMNADGSDQHCLTNQATADKKPNPALPRDFSPSWAPDGQHIAFVSTRTRNQDIWVVNSDGSNPLDITQSTANNYDPAWSPDLHSIAFTSERDGNPEVCVMDVSGFNQRCLTNERTPNKKLDRAGPADNHPAWSPDSQKIAFVSTREKARNQQVFVMNADGSNPVDLTKKITSESQPTWSADGQSVAFVSNRDGLILDIYTTTLDGSGQTRLTFTTKGGDFEPAYFPPPIPPGSTATPTLTDTPNVTFTPIPTGTPTVTVLVPFTFTALPTFTNTSVPSTGVPSTSKAPTHAPPIPTFTPSNTSTATATSTGTATGTATDTATDTATNTATATTVPCTGSANVVSLGSDTAPSGVIGELRYAIANASSNSTITFC